MTIAYKIKSNWTHVLTWVVFFVLMAASSFLALGPVNALLRSLLGVLVLAIVFYLNYLFLLPVFLEKNKYVKYFLAVFILLVLGVAFATYTDLLFFDLASFIDRGYLSKEYIEHLPKQIFKGRILVINTITILGTLFLSTILRGIVQRQKDDINKVKLESKIIEAESELLRSQINPHFIFNALNNIYSLSQIQSPKAPDAIHKLSQILRYVIYDNSDKFVNIEREIDYILSYIDLQKMKDDEIEENIKLDLNIQNSNIHIAPMLLIPFVENSFKHSYIEDTKNGWITIKIETIENKLSFTCENSIPQFEIVKDKVGGVGLENVKKRLELIYPNTSKLKILQKENVFSVSLDIVFD